jgi:hypothetical protein
MGGTEPFEFVVGFDFTRRAAVSRCPYEVESQGADGWPHLLGVPGVLFVLFSAMNYFTHIGLLINSSDSF